MRQLKLNSLVTNGKLDPIKGKQLVIWLGANNNKVVEITAQVKKKTRSISQNSYMWGVVIPFVQDIFKDHGTLLDSEETHNYLKEHVGKMREIMTDMNGEVVSILRSSTKLTTQEFNEYIEHIARWAADLGYLLPSPGEL